MAIVLPDAALSEPLATTNPDAPDEAVRWFRARTPVTRDVWDAMDARARRRAFTVSRVTALDVVAGVWRAVDRAVSQGTRLIDFKREVGAALASAWGGANAPRLNTVFRNNVQLAYGAGRYAQMTEPDVLRERPFWRFDAILDSRTTPICEPLDGLIRPADDAWWRSHYPPLHHQCRSGVATLTAEQAHDEGGAGAAPDADPADGWGATPDAGEWQPDAADYPAPLWGAFRERMDDDQGT